MITSTPSSNKKIRAKSLFSGAWYVGSAIQELFDENGNVERTLLICKPEKDVPFSILIDPKTIEYFGD